jgi:tRNA(Arg) A34 adenosine deaminase TadA
MCRKSKITNVLYGLAEDSPCSFKHAAAVVRGSKILSTGVNNSNRTKWKKNITVCFHAEMDALRTFLAVFGDDYTKFNKLCMWAIRIPNESSDYGLLRKSNPCMECFMNLQKYGFGKVAFSNENGDIDILKLSDYSTTYRSNAQKTHNIL